MNIENSNQKKAFLHPKCTRKAYEQRYSNAHNLNLVSRSEKIYANLRLKKQ